MLPQGWAEVVLAHHHAEQLARAARYHQEREQAADPTFRVLVSLQSNFGGRRQPPLQRPMPYCSIYGRLPAVSNQSSAQGLSKIS
jgi:hypothetical protein